MNTPAGIFVDNVDVRNSDAGRGTVTSIIGHIASIQLSSGEVLSGVNVTGGAAVGDDVALRYERGQVIALGRIETGGGYASGIVLGGGSGSIGSGLYVPLSRNITTTNGVMGGGTLAADLTLQVDGTVARQGWAVNAGAGLSGGGGISASGITLSVDLAYVFGWSGVHTFGAGQRVSSSQVIELGWGIAGGKQTDAGKIGYQAFSTALDIVGAGAVSGSRMVRLWDDTTIVRSIGSVSFASGFTGSGWRIDNGIAVSGQTTAEFDNLTIRGLMRVYELLIQKIRTGNGSYLFAPGGKVASVSGTGPYTLAFESDHGLAANDLIRAQKFDLTFGGVYQSNLAVSSVASTTVLTATLSSGVAPAAGYEYARIGNASDANRQGGVYITSDDTGAPYLDVFDGINSFAAWGSTTPKARLGRLAGVTDALWGVLSGYGLYTQSGYFTGGIRAMSGRIDGVLDIGASGGIYQGSGSFASPSTGLKIFNSSGVGIIAGYNAGAVQWQAGTDGKLYAGAGNVLLDAGGISIAAQWSGYTPDRAYKFTSPNSSASGVYSYYSAYSSYVALRNLTISGVSNYVAAEAIAAGTADAQTTIGAYNSVGASTVSVTSLAGIAIYTSSGDISYYPSTGRNYFKDSELSTGNGLRVGAAWSMYGIYAESGYCVVGGISGVNLQNGVVQITSGVGILRASIDATYNALAVNGGVHLTGSNTTYQFDARDNSGQTWQLYSESNNARLWVTGVGDVIRFDNGGNASKLSAGTAWTSFSDERVKNVKGAYTKGLSEILRIQPIVYDYNSKAGTISNGKNNAGIIAQEIREIFPDAVSVDHDTGMLMFDSTEITWALVNAVKEVAARVKKLEHHYH